MRTLVLDTNIVLDLFVFADTKSAGLKAELDEGIVDWIATAAMRNELMRVLGYAHLLPRLNYYQLTADDVLARFDRHARIVDAPTRAGITCSDPDDQIFIDLAVAHKCLLLSKDAAVLSMAKRLAALEVRAAAVMPVHQAEPRQNN